MALRLENEHEWTGFLLEAGIPADESAQYAKIFKDNRLRATELPDLNMDLLKSLGVTVIGDALAIIRHAKSKFEAVKMEDSTVPSQPTFKAPAAVAKLPTINADMTHPQFRKFLVDWEVYKNITGLPTNHIANHIYSACCSEVQSTLINTNKSWITLHESELLQAIESIVTKVTNPAVHRMGFRNIIQQEGESIKEFVVRLRSAAVDCAFACPSCHFDISATSIKDQFISGLGNNVLQTDILAKADTLLTLEDIIKHSEAFEGALRDQAKLLLDNPSTVARISDHRRSKLPPPSRKPAKTDKQQCSGCGSKDHGVFGTTSRRSSCPAWGKICENCKIPNHSATVCRIPPQSSAHSLLVAHVEYNVNSDTFSAHRQGEIQEIPAKLTPISSDGTHLASATLPLFPDSGANICLGGTKHLSKLNLKTSQLQPCHKRVSAVGGSILICKGWIMMRFEINGHIATQPLYFCDKVDRIYFSKQGCMEANILSPSFPFPMQEKEYANKAATVEQSSANRQPQQPSNGPSIQAAVDVGPDNTIGQDVTHPTPHVERTPPPPRPAQPPFPPIAENIPRLEKFIKQQFASSAFNKSPPFPAMNAPPAHIHLLPNSKPYARHSPINVPRNWEKEVKAMLDRNVELEIIAVAPIGSSVTWCSPMVIVQKSDGSPRLTVDFQRLNANCLRETHHTPSPFTLAMQIPPHQWKTVLDAVDGYHAIKLDEESQWITMFITQWGRYIFLRMPQGYLASGDAYTRRFDEITKDIKRKVKIIDDTLLYDNTIEAAFFATWDYLTLCANNGIVMNVSKFKFCR